LIAANVTPQPPGVHALREVLAEELASAHRRPFGILTFTIDDYPVLLGSFGWRVVDTLAQMVSSMLDASTCRLFQFASDSYAVVLLDRGNKNLTELSESVQKIVVDVQRAMCRQADVSVSASIGMLVVGLQTHACVDRLVDHVIAAGFLAREQGRHGVAVVDGGADLAAQVAPLRWTMRIRQAIEHDRLVLFAQPIRPLRPDHVGPPRQEILVRLRDPGGSIWSPREFLPIADRHGLTPDIDRWVVRHAFAWVGRQRGAGVHTSINLSGLSLAESGLVDYVQQMLDAYQVQPSSICFEITESVGIEGFQLAASNIAELRRRGLRFALDDFGSGMASLRYLRDLPLDYLKIDGSFIRDVARNQANQYLVSAMRDMSLAFGLETIAEYVEDEATAAYLAKAGIDYAQGHAIGRPMPLSEGPFAL